MNENLVNPNEKVYFVISLIISSLVYLLLVISCFGIVYIIIGLAVAIVAQGIFIGSIKGNAIRVSGKQFPEVYQLTYKIATQMEINPVPPIYILQAGGLLNAFATRFFGRNFVIIYSDVLELAYEKGENALAFVICHELAHIKRKHLVWHWLIWPSKLIPFMGNAYSRACEYTCDKFGAYYQPDGAVDGLLVLASGKKLYRITNPKEFCDQADQDGGFWVWFSELLSTHPNLPKRLKALGLNIPDKSS